MNQSEHIKIADAYLGPAGPPSSPLYNFLLISNVVMHKSEVAKNKATEKARPPAGTLYYYPFDS